MMAKSPPGSRARISARRPFGSGISGTGTQPRRAQKRVAARQIARVRSAGATDTPRASKLFI